MPCTCHGSMKSQERSDEQTVSQNITPWIQGHNLAHWYCGLHA